MNEHNDQPIVVENLTKKFGDFVAVDNVSFSVNTGEVFGWLGPNGAGKTTTIRMLLGLLRPTSGSTHVLGFNSATQTKAMHGQVGYMSQQFTLYNELTPRENIRFYGMVYGLSGQELRQRQVDIIHMAGLEGRENVLTNTLSGGWKQRLALGCAIVHRPKVVFLDEPTAGVDPISRREFWVLIYDMTKAGVTVLVTTHYMDEAELCQRVGFISQGRLVALDSPSRLKQTQMRGQVLEINTANPDLAMRSLKAAQQSGQILLDEVALYGAQIHAVVPDAQQYKGIIQSLLEGQGIAVNTIEWIAPTLEDVFISSVSAPTTDRGA
ncbi:MAG TPA: ABC transporter ATP-binding protein [Aggregatilineales bacterium]|nr:ABC transporter ATP-binding protein [Aggregatilineales bacterium]